MKTRFAMLAVPALIAGVVAGCGDRTAKQPASQDSATSVPAAGGRVDVALDEFSIRPATSRVAAGTVVFDVRNTGKIPHEMVVMRTDVPARALGGGGHVPETGVVGEVEDVAPGAGKRLKLDLEPGHYALICNVPGHYGQGMHADFTVG